MMMPFMYISIHCFIIHSVKKLLSSLLDDGNQTIFCDDSIERSRSLSPLGRRYICFLCKSASFACQMLEKYASYNGALFGRGSIGKKICVILELISYTNFRVVQLHYAEIKVLLFVIASQITCNNQCALFQHSYATFKHNDWLLLEQPIRFYKMRMASMYFCIDWSQGWYPLSVHWEDINSQRHWANNIPRLSLL